jgi:hypothetical protein
VVIANPDTRARRCVTTVQWQLSCRDRVLSDIYWSEQLPPFMHENALRPLCIKLTQLLAGGVIANPDTQYRGTRYIHACVQMRDRAVQWQLSGRDRVPVQTSARSETVAWLRGKGALQAAAFIVGPCIRRKILTSISSGC